MRPIREAIRAAFHRLGVTIMRTPTYDALCRERDELLMRATSLDRMRAGASAAVFAEEGEDYQRVMALQALKAAYDDLDAGFRPLMDSVRAYTMTSVERMYHLYKCAEYLSRSGTGGDMLECGVWRGGSMMLIAKKLVELGDTSRTLHLFDTYEGHPKPDSEHDVDLWGYRAVDEWRGFRKTDETSDWARVSIEEVEANMALTGYPAGQIRLVKGMVEKTAAANAPQSLSLLRLDTDWYASAKISLEVFWPRLVVGGILIVDDYGHYKGQRKAVDEFFAANPQLLHRVDYACRAVVKTR